MSTLDDVVAELQAIRALLAGETGPEPVVRNTPAEGPTLAGQVTEEDDDERPRRRG